MGATKEYMKGYREGNLIENVTNVNLEKKDWHASVKKFYKEWTGYNLNKIQTELLMQACNQLQLIEECKRILQEKGISTTTVTGIVKINPVTKVLKDSTTSFSMLLRLLSESMEEQ